MGEQLRERLRQLEDDFLIEQYLRHRDDYTPGAYGVIREELVARGFGEDQLAEGDGQCADEQLRVPTSDAREAHELAPLACRFHRKDLLVLQSVLSEAEVACTIESNGVEQEPESTESFCAYVAKDNVERIENMLDEHFDRTDGFHVLRHTGTRDRLRSYSLSEAVAGDETVQVSFSAQERHALLACLDTLQKNADSIEKETGRTLFYFDNLAECETRLRDGKQNRFPRPDLLTILETLQVLCDRDAFPDILEGVAEGVMDFLDAR